MTTSLPYTPPPSAIDDLTGLEPLTEETVVSTLRARFLQDQYFTRLGSSILVAINPYKDIRPLLQNCSEQYQGAYKDTLEQQALLPPHILQHTNYAYFHMRRSGQDQAIVLSGQSGSGKSEWIRWIVFHFITLSSAKKSTKIPGLVQSACHVLEAFGHARTAVNSSASRFGKYMELQFNERGRMIGVNFLDYCLHDARVRPRSPDEHSVHIFYYLLYGLSLEQRQQLHLHSNDTYTYLGKDSRSSPDTEALALIQGQLKSLGCPKSSWTQLLQILAAILHLGNIQFVNDPGHTQESALVKTPAPLNHAAELLGVDSKSLENALVYQTRLIERDLTTMYLNADQAAGQRDRLAEVLFRLIFTWLVELLNKKLYRDTAQNFIGILDFPGTDIKATPTMDRFCVNLAHERLYHIMMHQVVDSFFPHYEALGLDIPEHIRCASTHTSACVALLTGNQNGLTAVLGRGGTVADVVAANKENPCLVTRQQKPTSFAVQHFWGTVAYPTDIFSYDQDPLCVDFLTLFSDQADSSRCTNALVRKLFTRATNTSGNHGRAKLPSSSQQLFKPRRSPSVSRKKAATVSDEKKASHETPLVEPKRSQIGQFAGALEDLMNTLSDTRTWWILCLRPNELLLPNSCDSKKVAMQIAGFQCVALATHTRREYPVIMDRDDFGVRYMDLVGPGVPGDPWVCLRDRLGWNDRKMAITDTKIYLSISAWMTLENELRGTEKKEQRRARCITRGILFEDDLESDAQSPSCVDPQDMECSEDCSHSQCFTDTDSMCPSSHMPESVSHMGTKDLREMQKKKEKARPKKPLSKSRRMWLILAWLATWWIPSPILRRCGGMWGGDVRMAWREKVALCLLIFLLCSAMVWFIVFFGQLVCPRQDLFTHSELQAKSHPDNAYLAIRGEVFDLTSFAPRHWASEVIPTGALYQYAGQDASNLFPVQVSALCDGVDGTVPKEVMLDSSFNLSDPNAMYHDFRYFHNDYRPDWYFEQMVYLRKNYRVGFMGYDTVDIRNQANFPVQMGAINTRRFWAVIHNNVYDLTAYMMGGLSARTRKGYTMPSNIQLNFLDNGMTELFRQLSGTDISRHFDALPLNKAQRERQLTCLRNLFFVGKIDDRNSPQCLFSEHLLLIITTLLCGVILFKFLAALRLGRQQIPEEYDKFIVCQVPCYTEGEESLRKTIDSLTTLKYDDKRKLLFLIADGMIVGSGNDRPTPHIVLDILGVDYRSTDPPALSFVSLGEGARQHNMAKVYSGLYEKSGHMVPFIVVVKVGTPLERQKPGNRGKRDSQMVLLQFLNKIHFDSPMSPLELEMYHQLKNVIGVNPSFYEFVLMIDADTEVLPDSLNRMVSCFVNDAKIVGLCGETMLSNEKETWVTMIQVYEYYISHHLAKAFESMFGSVTCLPGCFCMYRIRSPTRHQPLLVAPQVIRDYSENDVDTLHKKNLLHLGEDRYLTTLILKHFPNYKTKFTPDAACRTNAPDQWPVLLSQRRRWINSTVHNLGELIFLPRLCGFCCFSMRFVVVLDLLSTLVMPAVVCYLGYLVYQLCTKSSQVPLMSIVTLAGVYGLQALIFILRRKWEHIGWMIVYILAIPVFSFLIPLYAFWHFDDFTWGSTRVVVGDKGQKTVMVPDEGEFDSKEISFVRWKEYEAMLDHRREDDLSYHASVCDGYDKALMALSEKVEYNDAVPLYVPDPSQLPSDAEITQEISHMLNHADLTRLTKKHVREGLARTFGVDMTPKREFINRCIESMLAERLF